MKVGLLQLNPVVGDLVGNARRIREGYLQAVEGGAELVVAPELALCGYPPRDLLLKERFLVDCETELAALAAEIGAVALIVGAPGRSPEGPGQPLTNSAFVLQSGEILARQDKTLLPNYDVFDEQRYFRPADFSEPVEIDGRSIGLTICEDIWSEDYLPAPLYHRCPPADLAAAGVELIVNLSASPYALGKPERRAGMIAELAGRLEVPVVYCNAVGGNDQLIFDGHSCVLDAVGRCLGQLGGFQKEVAVVDLAGPEIRTDPVPACEQLHDALVLGLRDYVEKCGFRSVVLGLSGGIDSALTAALAVDALGPEAVHGILMPSIVSSDHSISDALALAANLGISTETVPIEPMVQGVLGQLQPLFAGQSPDVTEENIQARLRGLTLMAVSNKFGHLLLTTGNKSELAVGYCTIYGDMCGGLAVIADLPKTRVYELSEWMNRDGERIPRHTIAKAPSAELRPGQTDQDSLPPYPLLDAILEAYVEGNRSVAEIVASGLAQEEIVRWVARRVDLNEWKRQQAAPGLRVTSRAFGMGRRLPIAQGYVGR